MFGAFRLLLALMVVWYHLVDWQFSGPVAVFGFYCLSGYLMTKVVNEVYSDGLAGFNRFVLNRALRIYPAYWFALAVAAVAALALPAHALQLSPNYAPTWLWSDLTILGHKPFTRSLLPQSWSLGVELIYYLFIAALLGRRRLITVLWFVFGSLIIIAAAIYGFDWPWFYSDIMASSLPFATGAMIYHFRSRIPPVRAAVPLAAAIGVVLAGLLMPRDFGKAGGVYVGLAASAVAVAALIHRKPHRLDTVLGDFAYPVFLLHYPAGAIALVIVGHKGVLAGSATLLLALPLSWVAIQLTERPLKALRTGLRRPRQLVEQPSVAV